MNNVAIKSGCFATIIFTLISFYQDVYAADAATIAPEQNVILGVLEENANPIAYPDGIHKNYSREVRIVFQKDGAEWKAFPTEVDLTKTCFNDCDTQFFCGNKNSCESASNINQCQSEKSKHCHECGSNCARKTLAALVLSYPVEVKWTIAFNGKSLEQLTGKTQQSLKYYSNVGFQDIVSSTSIPTIGKRSRDYSGYLSEPVYRPLIAVSQPNFKDPEEWKPSTLPADLVKLMRQQFRQKFPKVENCTNPEENIARPWPYKDSDIQVTKTYSSNRGWTITQLRLNESRCDYSDDDAFGNQWFAISPAKEIAFLGNGIWLVDAGDYDNDGKSELVFAINRENRGGYELFYDNFKKQAMFEFGYH